MHPNIKITYNILLNIKNVSVTTYLDEFFTSNKHSNMLCSLCKKYHTFWESATPIVTNIYNLLPMDKRYDLQKKWFGY